MEQSDYGEVIAQCLSREKIKYLFTLSGAHIIPIYSGCEKEGINIIHFRDERAAVHAAEGYARVSKYLGVACVTAGVGLTNAITGIAAAASDNIPLLVLAGRHSIIDDGKGGLQELYGVEICKSITKWCGCAYHGDNVVRFLRKAIKEAVTPTRGPTLLEIPFDVMLSEATFDIQKYSPILPIDFRIESDTYEIKKALELLISAEKPLIVAGDDVYWSNAEEEIRRLAKELMIPVYGTRLGTGVIPEDDILNVHRAWRTKITREADVILAFGVNFWHGEGYGEPPTWSADAKIIQVDPDPRRIFHNIAPAIFLCGDSKTVAQKMLQYIEKHPDLTKRSTWLQKINEIRSSFKKANYDEYSKFENHKPIHPSVLAKYIYEFVKEKNPIVIIDGADSVSFVEKWIEINTPGLMVPINPLGVVGNGIPLGIGSKLAAKDRCVLVNIGDGGFGICGMEIETAVRYEVPILVVLHNNSAWGATYSLLKFIYGKGLSTVAKLSDKVRYDKIVESLGGYGIYVEDPDKIKSSLNEAFKLLEDKRPALINVELDREVFGPIYTGRIAPLFYRPRPKKISISIQYPFKEEHKFLYPGAKIDDYHKLNYKPIARSEKENSN